MSLFSHYPFQYLFLHMFSFFKGCIGILCVDDLFKKINMPLYGICAQNLDGLTNSQKSL